MRNTADIRASWDDMISETREQASQEGQTEEYVKIQERVRALAHRVNCSDNVFNPRKFSLPSIRYTY